MRWRGGREHPTIALFIVLSPLRHPIMLAQADNAPSVRREKGIERCIATLPICVIRSTQQSNVLLIYLTS